MAFLGGVVMVTANERHSSTPSHTVAPEAPPEYPSVLSETEAVGMAVARLVVAGVSGGVDGHSKRLALLEVDGAQSRLSVEATHAELQNLRVQTSPDKTWLTLDVCYEYTSEWRVTSLGPNEECAR
jgi:hypothetical protein